MKKESIKTKYIALSTRYKGIVNVSPDRLKSIQSALDEYTEYRQRVPGGRYYYIATFCALFSFATAPYLISTYYDVVLRLSGDILMLLSKEEYLREHIYIHISCTFLLLAVPTYTLNIQLHHLVTFGQLITSRLKESVNKLVPLLLKHEQSQKIIVYFESFDGLGNKLLKNELIQKSKLIQRPKTLSFFLYAFILNYTVLVIPILYLNSFKLLPQNVLQGALTVWLMIPSPLFGVAPTFLLMTVIALIAAIFGQQRTKANKARLYPNAIIHQLMSLLEDIDSSVFKDPYAGREKDEMVKRIQNISSLIRRMQWLYPKELPVHFFIRSRFKKAANAFSSLVLYVSLPQPDSVVQLRRAVLKMLNVFLSGNFWNLPEVPFISFATVVEERKSGVVKRVVSFVGLVIFLSFPIVIWIFIVANYQPTIDETSKTLLTIIYSVWAVFGILSFSNTLASDVKDLLFGVVRLFVAEK